MSEDARLVEEAIAGDSAAFGLLVRKYQNRLFNTLVSFVGSSEEAEDVVQDAFVQAFLKISSYRGRSSFYTWLYRIAFNTSVSRRRRKRPEVSVEQMRESRGDDPVDLSDVPSKRLELQERAELVRAALDELSDEHRAVLVLREIEGCRYEAIAEVLDLRSVRYAAVFTEREYNCENN